ncbi:MAG: DUF805 domain-containing protein [Schwartzia sp.]|nr:DUF805 domain-containing protein [Schwartzia sp. (in: firmicutes)]
MAKFCQNCGSPLEGAGKFCPSCGAQIIDAGAAPEESVPTQPPEKTPDPQQEMNNPPMRQESHGQPQPMMSGQPGQPQPMMHQNVPGQNAGQQPYGGWPGQGGAQNAYGAAGAAAFAGGAYVPDEGLYQMFLRYDNRLNRTRYIMRGRALIVAVTVAAFVLGIVLAVIGAKESTIGTMGTLIGLAGAVPGCMLAVRRLHDLDRPAWWIIGNFVPIVNIALSLYLLLAKGTDGPNQYGPDPLEGTY